MVRSVCYLLLLAALGLLLVSCAGRGTGAPTTTGVDPGQDTPFFLVDLADPPAGGHPWEAHLQVRPVAPESLADRPGHAPLNLGHHYTHTISPDGRTMAAFVWPVEGGGRGTGVLHLIDLASWSDTIPGVSVNVQMGELRFGPDGRSLYWAMPRGQDPVHGMPREYVLQRYDLGSHTTTDVVTFPASFVPSYAGTHFTRAGDRLIVYGLPTDARNLAEDAPHLLVVDPIAGRIVVDLRLAGVKGGQFRTAAGGYEMFRPGLAWDLSRDRLYVAHADEERVTVVDLAGGKIVQQATIRPRASIAARIAQWLVPTAAAKDNPATSRWAVLSADGSRLYITEQRTERIDAADSHSRARTVSSGIRVVDTDDLAQVRRLDLPQIAAGGLVPSPDGRRLLVHTFPGDERADDGGATAGGDPPGQHRLLVLDAASFDEIGGIDVERAYSLHGYSPDGRYVYISLPGEIRSMTAGQWTWRVLDPSAGRVVTERRLGGMFEGALLSPAPNR